MYRVTAKSCCLLDLPSELIHECMPGRDSLLPALAACRQLFIMLCGSVRMRLAVGEDAKARRRALMQSFPSLQKLAIHFAQELTREVLEVIIPPSPSAEPHVLEGIVDMTISAAPQGVDGHAHFDRLIPQSIAEACPQLATLTLCKLRIIQHQPWLQQQQPSHLPNLQQLVLDQCVIDMTREAVDQQLQIAPRLEHVKLVTNDMGVVSAFSSKVSELVYNGRDWDESKLAWAFAVVQQPCLMLRKLVADRLYIHDGMIEDFLKAVPNLEHVHVMRVWFVHDWSKALQCKWKQLYFMMMPDYEFLAFLPTSSQSPMSLSIHGRQDIQVKTSPWGVEPNDYPEVLQPGSVNMLVKHSADCEIHRQQRWEDDWKLQLAERAQAIAQQAGGFTPVGTGIATFYVHEQEPPVVQQILLHVVSMINNLECIVLMGNVHVNTQLLTQGFQVGHLQALVL